MKKVLLISSTLIICLIFSICFSMSYAAEISNDEVETIPDEVEIEEIVEEKEENNNETNENSTNNETITNEELKDEEEENQVQDEPTEINNIEEQVSNNEDIVQQEVEQENTEENQVQSSGLNLELGAMYGESSSTGQTIKSGKYQIASALDNTKVMDIERGSQDSGANIHLFVNKNLDNQKFSVTFVDGYYIIEALISGKVLDVAGAGQSSGTNVWQWQNNGTDAQKWIIQDAGNGYYYIISKCNNLYIDVAAASSADGTNIQVYKGNGTAAQKFKFIELASENGTQIIQDGEYQIVSGLNGNKVLDIDAPYTVSGVNLRLNDNLYLDNQAFKVFYNGDGTYTIGILEASNVLDVSGAGKTNGTNVGQWKSNNTNAQKWVIKSAGDNYYYIISKCNDLYLDIAGASTKNGTNIQVYKGNGTAAQKFTFIKYIPAQPAQTISDGTYMIASALNNSKIIEIEQYNKSEGINVQLGTSNNLNSQRFTVTYLDDGYYLIENAFSNKVLDVANGSKDKCANIWQWSSNDTDAQKWFIKDAGDGYYYIVSKLSGYTLDIAGGSIMNGTNIQVFSENGTSAQKFKFIPAEITSASYGIDVSYFQGDIDWYQVSQTQDFAIIRVGYRGYRNPRLVEDEKFRQNMQGATNAGLNVGAYFFTTAINTAEAIEEANWTADRIAPYNITYPVAIDVEWTNGDHDGRSDYLSVWERTEIVKAFCETIKARGYTPMIYASRDWCYYKLDMSQLRDYDVWIAHYTNGGLNTPTNYNGLYTTWQYSSKGYVTGINGYVDMNVCYSPY